MRFPFFCRPSGLLPMCLWWAATCVCLPASAQSVPSTLSFEQALQAASAQSQRVVASQAQTRAARERLPAAGQWADPVLTFGINDLPVTRPDRFSLTRDSNTQRSIGVSQEWTRADKRQARTERAQHEVEAALIAQRATLIELQRETALAWLDLSLQDDLRALLQAQLAPAEQQVEAAQTLYRNGRGTQADVYAARGDVEQQRDRIAQADRQIAVATARLARWIGDGAAQPLGPRPDFVLPAWLQGDLADHLARHPNIATSLQQQAIAESEVALARAAKQADWTVALSYSQRGAAYSNQLSLNLSVPLQWDPANRQDRELAARLAEVERARAARADLQREHEAEVRTMLQQWRSATERAHRYDTALLPLAEQRSAAALSAYRAGTGSLPMLFDARRGELGVRIERLRIEMDRAQLWAQLNFLLPGDEPSEVTAHVNVANDRRSVP